MSDPKEKFFRHFQAEITTIQDQLDVLATTSPIGGERKDCTDAILAGISRLNNEVADASEYVPSYDQRAYAQAIKGLTEKLNEVTSKFAPKSRFQFKPRTAKTAPAAIDSRTPAQAVAKVADSLEATNIADNGSAAVDGEEADSVGHMPVFKNYNEELSRPAPDGGRGGNNVRKPSFSAAKNIAINGHTGLHIILPATASRATSSGSLTDLDRCIVDMTAPTSTGAPFAGLALKGIKNSLIVAGHVAGPVHITALKDTVVVVAARQVRIHECKNVDVYLHCASHPIIEDCSNMRFAPIPEFYMLKSDQEAPTNQWDQVDDFKWLKAEASPNWSILPEDQRLPDDVWKNTVCGNPSLSTDDILRKVGALKPKEH
ncbi:tubulin-specific chaperone C [Microdochium trichocladiopsis]|uniref:Tubulin-specific chaperone C n=1 Tax=Microdochium trichocladiopsis TaxID=1682393 RepID=A0A9P8Y510_9PEZI|nr:tubulin-specific chaperone C [Microdochium trichocladiopsis]KAH7029160.1 tubulin-specific chaperone C [Microdochium trichocladiopsis]